MKIKDIEKYNEIIKKLGLNKPEQITEEQSDEMVKEYLSWYESIKRTNLYGIWLMNKEESWQVEQDV